MTKTEPKATPPEEATPTRNWTSEAFRQQMDYYDAHSPQTGSVLARLAEARPETLACMHGSAWRGDGAKDRTHTGASCSVIGRGSESARRFFP